MKKLLFTLGLISTIFIFPRFAFADGNCTNAYGGGGYGGYGSTTCVTSSLSINKTVQNPVTNQFVDNLDSSTPFTPGQAVYYQLTVSNTGNTTLNNVVVKDILPSYIDFATSDGSFDSNSKTVTINLSQLNAGDSKTYNVAGRFESANNLPDNTNITCVVNQATATADGVSTSQDNAQACVEKSTAGTSSVKGLTVYTAPVVSTTPGTGADALAFLALIPAAFAGFKFRNKAIRG